MQLNKIIRHNVLEPWPLPEKSVNCIVTSPPYYGLRDYGIDGQIGLEETIEEYLERMIKVFSEAHRVLKDNGTIWVNIGDSYATGAGGNNMKNEKVNAIAGCSSLPGENGRKDNVSRARSPLKHAEIKSKDLIGIPWMLAIALRSAGWYLRQDIIWHKPNPMPESVTDRCTKSHEYIFLFSKSKSYYFDAFSIATPYADKTFTAFGSESKGYGDGSGLIASENWHNSVKTRKPKDWKMPDGWDTGQGSHGSFHKNGREKGKRKGTEDPKMGINGNGFKGHSGNYDAEGNPIGSGKANKRSVWTVSTRPFPEAHFATFPEELIVDCIKAGCPAGGIVLDPFMGAGTTALVSRKLDRNFIGFELNPDYIQIAETRLKKELGFFI